MKNTYLSISLIAAAAVVMFAGMPSVSASGYDWEAFDRQFDGPSVASYQYQNSDGLKQIQSVNVNNSNKIDINNSSSSNSASSSSAASGSDASAGSSSSAGGSQNTPTPAPTGGASAASSAAAGNAAAAASSAAGNNSANAASSAAAGNASASSSASNGAASAAASAGEKKVATSNKVIITRPAVHALPQAGAEQVAASGALAGLGSFVSVARAYARKQKNILADLLK